MKIDNTSFFFNAPLAPGEKGGTAAWGTSVGQSKAKGYKIDLSKTGIQDVILGMNYCIKTDSKSLDISSGSKKRELLFFSIFDKIYINEIFLEGVSFILLLIKEHSENHDGRIIISYPPYAKYLNDDSEIINSESIVKMAEAIDCTDGAWFAHEISVKNQDELHFSAIVLDKSIKVYANSKERNNEWDLLTEEFNEIKKPQNQIDFDIKSFQDACKSAGLIFSSQLLKRFTASLSTKPFVLLSGLSGSGKTKLAEAFAMWVCESEEQYALIPVGADWTNREPLLGYPNALKDSEYVKPDNDALDLLLRAKDDENRPYFLILDEMNLSHVERYFADFLSTMESKNSMPLHKMEEEVNDIPNKIKLPKNLFIVGTVNIDETTYMFSPKVLDRANTIEFRVNDTDISDFLKKPKDIDLEKLNSKGVVMATNFVEIATATKNGVKIEENYQLSDIKDQDVINNFFIELQKAGAEFGYRTAFEMSKLIYKLEEFGLTNKDDKLDIAIMQKMLPKLHGSRTKLTRTLKPLAKLCLKNVSDNFDKEYFENFENINFKKDGNIRYKLSFEKIMRMYKNAVENGFASYAEA